MSIQRLLLISVLLVLSTLSLAVVAESEKDDIARLYVRGEARLMVAPDQVSVTLGVTSEAKKSNKAITENSKKMDSVVRALTLLGLTDKDYKTQNFRVQPVWSSRPSGAGSQWRPKIIGYRVNNSLHVTTKKLDVIGELIEKATSAGANQVHAVYFSLSDPRAYRQQAITQAMNNAKEDAQTLAAASGDKIARTLSLQLDNAAASQVRVEQKAMRGRVMMESMAMADAAPSPTIEAGDITVSASVSVVYELARP